MPLVSGGFTDGVNPAAKRPTAKPFSHNADGISGRSTDKATPHAPGGHTSTTETAPHYAFHDNTQ
jgi:hypothetical protein